MSGRSSLFRFRAATFHTFDSGSARGRSKGDEFLSAVTRGESCRLSENFMKQAGQDYNGAKTTGHKPGDRLNTALAETGSRPYLA
jgi:hypothetical protein